jgi:hypothetical protein
VLKPCCPSAAVEFRDNLIDDVETPVESAQDLSAGVRMFSNVFCLKGLVDPGRRHALPNNIMNSRGDCDRALPVPQHLRVQ